MDSLKDFIALLVAALQENEALDTFCQSKWKKSLTVEAGYKTRAEINTNNLPYIMITRPQVSKNFLTNTNRNTKNTFRLYCLFYQPDKTKALEELVEFEELIDDALTTPEPSTLGALSITPGESANDEGTNHPTYAMVMEVEIRHRR